MRLKLKRLKRAILYAKGLGIKVSLRPYVKYSLVAADWTTDGSEITLYTTNYKSETQLILDLIHELAHHLSFIHNRKRQPDKKMDRLLIKPAKKLSHKDRKAIYEMELEDSEYQERIFDELGLNIPKHKLFIERDLCNAIYEYWALHNRDPSTVEKQNMRRTITEIYDK